MNLANQVVAMLGSEEALKRATNQPELLVKVNRVYEDLQARGLVDPPVYKLSPMNSVPPKAMAPKW